MQLGRFKEERRPVWLEWWKTKRERQSRLCGGIWVYPTCHRKLRENLCFKKVIQDFRGGTVDKNSPAKTWVWALVWEDSTCCRRLKACSPNYVSLCAETTEACVPELHEACSATTEAAAMRHLSTTAKRSLCSPQLDRACIQQRTPSPAKIKK